MNRYRVYGNATVTVTIEVNADTEGEAYDKAFDELDSLTSYCGNGGTDKLVGVDGDDSSVSADNQIEYDDIELIGLAETDNEKCHHFAECGNEAEYELELVNGTTIHVCADCDESYGTCQVCGKAELSEEMSFANAEDQYSTCHLCGGYDDEGDEETEK